GPPLAHSTGTRRFERNHAEAISSKIGVTSEPSPPVTSVDAGSATKPSASVRPGLGARGGAAGDAAPDATAGCCCPSGDGGWGAIDNQPWAGSDATGPEVAGADSCGGMDSGVSRGGGAPRV